MKRIVWSAEMKSGVPQIDEQQKKLAGIVNQLAMAKEEGVDQEELSPIIRDFSEHLKDYFACEVRMFERYSPKNAPKHDEQRKIELADINSFRDRHKRGEEITEESVDYLHDWLVQHVLVADKSAADLMKSRGAK